MSLPERFKKENIEKILVYHYVEELVSDFTEYIEKNYKIEEITQPQLPFLLRIRFQNNSTQKDLVKLFQVSNGYASKVLRDFEDKKLITRIEDPENRRRKIVKLTEKGTKLTDEILIYLNEWENIHKENMTETELKTLKTLIFKFLNKK